jgi:polysaccharide pyruvyl transferase WcaK-like protein
VIETRGAVETSARPRRIGFWGNFGAGNWGNECTLQAIVHNVRKRLPAAELVCICSDPSKAIGRHGLEALAISDRRRKANPGRSLSQGFVRRSGGELREWSTIMGNARTVDTLVMTGTGMLTDTGEGPFGLPYDMFIWSVAAKARGGRLLVTNVGVEPIAHPLTKFFIGAALRLADYRSYRDAQSRELLRRAGFYDQGDFVYPDLAFSLPESMARRALAAPHPRPTVAVGVYDYRGRGQGGAEDKQAYGEYIAKLGRFVFWLLEQGFAVRILIGDLTYDEPVLEDLRAHLEANGIAKYRDRVEDEPARSVEDVMDQIAGVDIVVASRFHNVLLGLFLGKPVVSISYNEKNDALMTSMGLGAYCQTIDDFSVDRLIGQFNAVKANADELRKAIAANSMAYRASLEHQYDALFGVPSAAS